MKIFTALLFLLATHTLYCQDKKPIDYTVYDDWNNIGSIQQSKNGELVIYEVSPYDGDGNLIIHQPYSGNKKTIQRGKNASITSSGTAVVFHIVPQEDTIRQLKLDKVKKDKFPKDTLAIYWTTGDSTRIYPHIKSYQLKKETPWIAFLSEEDEREPCPEPKRKCRLFKKKNAVCENKPTSGTTLYALNTETGLTHKFHGVTDYKLSDKTHALTYTHSLKGEADTLSVHLVDLTATSDKVILDNQLATEKLTFDTNGEQLSFLSSTDTNKAKNYALYYWKIGNSAARLIIDSTTVGMPNGYTISANETPSFSWDGTKLYVGTAAIVKQAEEDTLLDSEKAKVDIWGGEDLRIQPQQLSERRSDKNQTYKAVYFTDNEAFVQLENDTITATRTMNHGNANFALSYNATPYQKSMTWDYPWKRDVYYTNLETGKHELIKTGQAYRTSLAPSGDYFVWYSGIDSAWFSKKMSGGEEVNLTENIHDLFSADANGYPIITNSEGTTGWTIIDEKEYYVVYSTNDIWLCPQDASKNKTLTNNKGTATSTTLRLQRFDYDSLYFTIENALVHGVDSLTKNERYYHISSVGNSYKLDKVIESPHRFIFIDKAEDSERILFRRSNFTTYPDLEASNLLFESPKKLTDVNPQQADYNWGTVEMVEWNSFEGIPLRGLLYKPEDFDSTASYPMIVYFYETYTENIHTYYAPRPTASIIYPTEYASNGYIIFIPDIRYEAGYPARSAYDCIVSGTDYLTDKYNWIDTNRLGLQGQSWGGYQTAQLITMTKKYRAAMAGAPVSNMFSAYGGIRWNSGLSRMFQYERGQSRIGYTIWEKPELYIENSPIFGLPNVSTPLLIMHNDGDGSVPWYQGIELYMGLRRLNQPVWLLNYNEDEHNLMRTANRRDLSRRMRQFFDYYLLGTAIPLWMEEGVPATEKGENKGLELKKTTE